MPHLKLAHLRRQVRVPLPNNSKHFRLTVKMVHSRVFSLTPFSSISKRRVDEPLEGLNDSWRGSDLSDVEPLLDLSVVAVDLGVAT